MTDELRDFIIDELSVSESRTIPRDCACGGGRNNYLIGNVIREEEPLNEVPCDVYRDFECNCTDCSRKLKVTDWPTGSRNTRIATCRIVDWKPQVEIDAWELGQYTFCERAFVEKLSEAANALGRVQEFNGYWYCGNVMPPRNGKPRPFFVCMDPDRARLEEIDLNTRPVLLVVADRHPKVKIQTCRFDTCVHLDVLGWKIEGAFFVDDYYPKDGPVVVQRIGDMPASDFWEKQRSVAEEVSQDGREYVADEIKKLGKVVEAAKVKTAPYKRHRHDVPVDVAAAAMGMSKRELERILAGEVQPPDGFPGLDSRSRFELWVAGYRKSRVALEWAKEEAEKRKWGSNRPRPEKPGRA